MPAQHVSLGRRKRPRKTSSLPQSPATLPQVLMDLMLGLLEAGENSPIDPSGAYRLRNRLRITNTGTKPIICRRNRLYEAAYALPEFNRAQTIGALLVSNLGRYPTAAKSRPASADAGRCNRSHSRSHLRCQIRRQRSRPQTEVLKLASCAGIREFLCVFTARPPPCARSAPKLRPEAERISFVSQLLLS